MQQCELARASEKLQPVYDSLYQQASKQANEPTNKPTNKQTSKPTNKQTNKQTSKPTNKQTNKQQSNDCGMHNDMWWIFSIRLHSYFLKAELPCLQCQRSLDWSPCGSSAPCPQLRCSSLEVVFQAFWQGSHTEIFFENCTYLSRKHRGLN